MENYSLSKQEANVVLVGSFNPAIFHPEWLARHELVTPDDLEGQDVEVVHNDLTKFSFSWFALDVIRNKFIIRTHDPSKFDPLRDLVVSIFTILEHTPTTHLGINYHINYSIRNESDWHKIGDTLAPKNIWNKVLPGRIGLTRLSVTSPRNDNYDGSFNVSVNPAQEQSVDININNDIKLLNEKEEPLSPSNILANNWDKAILFAKQLSETIIKEILDK